MTIKTYAIHGLSEWHGDIKAGAISVRVSFTGGTASPSGAVPAYFMTKDPVTQYVIENSKEFKSGFIRIEMQQTVAGEHPRMAMPKAGGSGDAGKNASEMHGNGTEPPTVDDGGKPDENGNTNEANEGVVRVADKSEAIEWLKEHYPDKGYTATKLKNKEAFEDACKECGVVFEIAE